MKPTFYLISWFLLCCFMPLGDITAIKTKIKINNNNSFHSNTQPLQCLSHYRENRVSTNSNMCCCGWGRDKLRDSRIIMPLCIFVFLALLGLQVFPRKRELNAPSDFEESDALFGLKKKGRCVLQQPMDGYIGRGTITVGVDI